MGVRPFFLLFMDASQNYVKDPVILFRLSNANSKPTCSHSLNWRQQRLCIPIGPHGAVQMMYYYYYITAYISTSCFKAMSIL